MDDWPKLKYRFGWDAFRTPGHFGLGVIVETNRWCVGVHLGKWVISYGHQVDWDNWAAATTTTSGGRRDDE